MPSKKKKTYFAGWALLFALIVGVQMMCCEERKLTPSRIDWSNLCPLPWDYGVQSLSYVIDDDHGSDKLQIIDIKVQNENGKVVPVRRSCIGPGKSADRLGNCWSWHLEIVPGTSNRMVIEARMTLGYGEYKIKAVLVKKSPEECDRLHLDPKYRLCAWDFVRDESSEVWIPPKQEGNKR